MRTRKRLQKTEKADSRHFVRLGDDEGRPRSHLRAFSKVAEHFGGRRPSFFESFLVPDPDDDTKNIMYACIEGPEAAMYTRGTSRLVNGEAHIDLPDHFRKLACVEGITVVLTPKSRLSLGLGFENENPSSFDVFELNNGKGNYEFAWEIKAVRKGHENWRAERPWDEALPGGDKKEQWQARLKSIAARRNQGKP